MALISIKALTDAAKARGFDVREFMNPGYVEIFAPEHTGPKAIWNWDSQYSTCDFVLNSRGAAGYGYNPFFYGPWHDGFVQSDCFGVRKLLAHPALAGVDVTGL